MEVVVRVHQHFKVFRLSLAEPAILRYPRRNPRSQRNVPTLITPSCPPDPRSQVARSSLFPRVRKPTFDSYHVQILRPHPPMRPHQNSLRGLLPQRGSSPETLRERRHLGDGEDGDGLSALLRARAGTLEDEEVVA